MYELKNQTIVPSCLIFQNETKKNWKFYVFLNFNYGKLCETKRKKKLIMLKACKNSKYVYE